MTIQSTRFEKKFKVLYLFLISTRVCFICGWKWVTLSWNIFIPTLLLKNWEPFGEIHFNPHVLFQMYLSEEDFESIFGMTREEFLAKPEWKRTLLKKDVGLFWSYILYTLNLLRFVTFSCLKYLIRYYAVCNWPNKSEIYTFLDDKIIALKFLNLLTITLGESAEEGCYTSLHTGYLMDIVKTGNNFSEFICIELKLDLYRKYDKCFPELRIITTGVFVNNTNMTFLHQGVSAKFQQKT